MKTVKIKGQFLVDVELNVDVTSTLEEALKVAYEKVAKAIVLNESPNVSLDVNEYKPLNLG